MSDKVELTAQMISAARAGSPTARERVGAAVLKLAEAAAWRAGARGADLDDFRQVGAASGFEALMGRSWDPTKGRPSSYAYRAAVRAISGYSERAWPEAVVRFRPGDDAMADWDPDPNPNHEAARRRLISRLELLTPRQQEVIDLRLGLTGPSYSLAEIGRRVGIPKSRVWRTVQAAAVKLEQHEIRTSHRGANSTQRA
jgi:RNA polymerase sigma factor (sigma-70 family)